MSYQVYDDQQAFWQLAPQWRQLLAESSTNHVFQTPEFTAVWWRHFGHGTLSGVALKDGEELTGILPLYSDQAELRSIGDIAVSDYLDGVIQSRQADVAWLAIEQFLTENTSWKALKLISLPTASSTREAIQKIANANGWQYQETQQDVCPVIALPPSWEEYLQQVGKKQRHEIRRKWKNLGEQHKLEFRVVEHGLEVSPATQAFIRLHRASSAEKASFWNSSMEAYFTDLIKTAADGGWLKLFFLDIDDTAAATMLCFDFNHRFYLYNSGFDAAQFGQLGVGQVLTSYTIQQAIELGRTSYDFLRGNEDYKYRYGAKPEPIFDLQLSR